MGMDVIGKNPVAATGEYFRANIWSWKPIWEYCSQLAPDICNKVEHGYSNDGDGLKTKDSRELGKIILEEIRTGHTHTYLFERNDYLLSLPLVPCTHCRATGTRQWYVSVDENGKHHDFNNAWEYDLFKSVIFESNDELPEYIKTEMPVGKIEIDEICNSCNGSGKVKQWLTAYNFDIDHLEEFGKFLLTCGGFKIC